MISIRDAHPVASAGCAVVGAVLGVGSAVAGAVALARGSGSGLRRRAGQDRERLVRWFGADADAVRDLPDRDPQGYLLRRSIYGPVTGVVLVLALTASASYAVWAAALALAGRIPALDGVISLTVAAIGVYLSVRLAIASGRWDTLLALSRLSDDATTVRVRELERTRAEVIRAIDDERSRIERALHDGIQQRAVVLALELGRARRLARPTDDALTDGLDNAVMQAQALLAELREVAWRIYPATLDEHGLAAALHGLSAHTTLPIQLDLHFDTEPPRDAAAAAYYVAAEAVTNAAKHSAARRIEVTVISTPDAVTVTAIDDGTGGADPSGSGLTGLRRRVAALDGTLTVDSPIGGPTTMEARIPCAS